MKHAENYYYEIDFIWGLFSLFYVNMEVDNDDVDQTLLQQFSCMGTTDRDELIKQLQTLVGNSLNQETASFFLDMNNWNLQGAVCSYFDFESPYKLPSMTLLKDMTVGEGESIPPSTKFMKTWRVQNNGDTVWPPGCCLQFNGGDKLSTTDHMQVMPVGVGCTADLSLEMLSPHQPGIYESKWRLTTPAGSFFGDVIWVIVTVAVGGTLATTQELASILLGTPCVSMEETATGNPFGPDNKPSSQALFQDSVQQTQDGDNMMC